MKIICLGSADIETIREMCGIIFSEYMSEDHALRDFRYDYANKADAIYVMRISASGANKWNDIMKQLLDVGGEIIVDADAIVCNCYYSSGEIMGKDILAANANRDSGKDLSGTIDGFALYLKNTVGNGYFKPYGSVAQYDEMRHKSIEQEEEVVVVLYIVKRAVL
jgi:hypothetical protein